MVLRLGTGDAYALLEALLRTEYGLERLPALARDGGGKPFFPARPELRFNVSHSGGLILCGAGAAAVGVDVERIRPPEDGAAPARALPGGIRLVCPAGRRLGALLYPLDPEGSAGEMYRRGAFRPGPGDRRAAAGTGTGGDAGRTAVSRLRRRRLAGGGLLRAAGAAARGGSGAE